ncbi:ATP-binding protein [Streptomyces sp. NPDC001568]|uniref:ATP-binding protein n=1 Tax=Streptomyces sp. NPDC001568 TaxID=3364588 RepID=UPI0036962B05
MSIAARPNPLLRVGVPDPLPVLDQAEVIFGRTGIPDRDNQRPRQARRIAAAWMGVWGLRAYADDARLLLSELVANAFRHGHGDVRVRVFLTRAYLAIEVKVAACGAPQMRETNPLALEESGRGLFLVDAYADGWAVSEDGSGVWCTLALAGAENPDGGQSPRRTPRAFPSP